MEKLNSQEQANEILRIAQKFGVEQNFLFLTTFKRYQVQLTILNELEQKIKEDGTLVTKEYVKGRENVYSNPLVKDLPRHLDSANRTLQTMLEIITKLGRKQEKESALAVFEKEFD